MDNPKKAAIIGRRDALLFALIFVALLVRLLLSPPILHHGEAREGLVVQEIVNSHQWILPFRNNELPSKPPLFHWLAAVFSFIFGQTDFTLRLPSAIAAMVMAISVFLMGEAMGGRRTAWPAVGALLGMYAFWDSGTVARVDMVFSACIAVSLAGFFFWYRDESRAARATCYLAAACAVLAKGPAGIVLLGLVIVGFLVMERRILYLWRFWSWPLAAVVLVLDLGWYLFAYQIGGNEFVGLQIWRENLDRFFGHGRFLSKSTSLNTLIWLLEEILPWNLVLLWSLIRRIRGVREDWAGRFLHSWWILIFGFFVLAARSRAVYLLPIYPAIALLAGRAMGDFIPSLSGPDSTQNASFPVRLAAKPFATLNRIGIGIALFDLTLMLVNHNTWQETSLHRSRLEFLEQVHAMIPGGAQLFATPKLDNGVLMVIAYRLDRDIARKPITCDSANEYFLSLLDEGGGAGVKTVTLASSVGDEIALLACSGANLQDPTMRSPQVPLTGNN